MSMLYEIIATTGKYTGRDGQEKQRYTKIGVVLEGKYGPRLKLESIPIGWDGWANLHEPRDRASLNPSSAPSPSGVEGNRSLDDDLPF